MIFSRYQHLLVCTWEKVLQKYCVCTWFFFLFFFLYFILKSVFANHCGEDFSLSQGAARRNTLIATVTNTSHCGTKGDLPVQGVIVQKTAQETAVCEGQVALPADAAIPYGGCSCLCEATEFRKQNISYQSSCISCKKPKPLDFW